MNETNSNLNVPSQKSQELTKEILEKWLLEKFGKILFWSTEDLIKLAKTQKIGILERDERLNKLKIFIQLLVIIYTSKPEYLQNLVKNIEFIELEKSDLEYLTKV